MGNLRQAVEVFKRGGIIIFPTDTVFGMGCRIGDGKAIKRLYKIKKRGKGKPTHILVKDFEQANKYGLFNSQSKKLTQEFWPGPLTLVVEARNTVPNLIRGLDDTIGIRQPNHKMANELIAAVGEPILAPSANFTGDTPPTRFSEIDKNLTKLVDYVLNFDCGGGEVSTIIRMTNDNHLLLREGAIKKELLFHKKELKHGKILSIK